MNNVYCVIMAGGKGERFWPCSRENTPKQLLNIVGKETLIEQTVLRLIPVVPFENILIITNRKYTEKMRQLLPQLPKENIIGEPCGRDTAPCVALAAGVIRKKAGTEDTVMILMPSDHCIHNVAELQKDLEICCRAAAEKPVLATIGIKPFAPSSDYGYIECGKELGEHLYQVRRFVEKPSREKAEEMLAKGNYKWNSGMFIWRVGTVLDIMRRHAPDLTQTMPSWKKRKTLWCWKPRSTGTTSATGRLSGIISAPMMPTMWQSADLKHWTPAAALLFPTIRITCSAPSTPKN